MTVEQLVGVLAQRDVGVLTAALDPDVVLLSDGGGQVVTPLRPVSGAREVAAVVASLVTADARLSVESVNGRPGVVVRRAGRACAVVVFQLEDALVTRAWVVLNPDKLSGWHDAAGVGP